ncbi:MAG: hypothetical protein RRC34_06805 [Lentisphaeria bacterium]|nr:hypothetical protein [Lentisphaeria bacterium]
MKTRLTTLAALLVTTSVMAGTRPFNLSLTPDIAVYDRSETIEGLTLSVWGENQQTSLALGIANGTTGNSAGFSLALVLNYADNYKGIQWAPINYTKGDFLGWQDGFVNYAGGGMKGLQMGVVNYAGTLTGLQLGFVNYAETGDAGVQIGLVNIIRRNTHWFTELPEELAPAMIFVNWRF